MVDGQADEAMSKAELKNVARRSEAAMALQATNRWAVSGTPLETASDVRAIFKFLRHQPFADDGHWVRSAEPSLQLDSVREDTLRRIKVQLDSMRKLHAEAAAIENLPAPPAKVDPPSYLRWQLDPQQYAIDAAAHQQYVQAMSDRARSVRPVQTTCLSALNAFQHASAPAEKRLGAAIRAAMKQYRCPLYDPGHYYGYGSGYGASTLALEDAPALARAVSRLADGFDAQSVADFVEAQQLVNLAEREPLVRRLGSGLDLLHSLLKPCMWRNTLRNVSKSGQLSLPPVHEVVIRIQLSASEDHVLQELQEIHMKNCPTSW